MERSALLRIRDEIRALHQDRNAVLADFFISVNVNDQGQLVVDGQVLELDGSKEPTDLRF